jgi:GNAT superfamily N-acetyltransferase
MILFKQAMLEDANELVKLKIEAFKEDVLLYGSGPSGHDSLDIQRNLIKNELCYKILNRNKVIGGFVIFNRGNNHFRLGNIFIHPDYQNKGIGTLAIKFIEKEFNYVKKWSLDTPYLSYRNHHFYEKMGYKKVSETKPEEESEFRLYEYEKIMG